MQFTVKVITNAKRNLIKAEAPDRIKVYLAAAPEKGKANDLLIKILAKAFHVPRSHIAILRGRLAKQKIIEIIA